MPRQLASHNSGLRRSERARGAGARARQRREASQHARPTCRLLGLCCHSSDLSLSVLRAAAAASAQLMLQEDSEGWQGGGAAGTRGSATAGGLGPGGAGVTERGSWSSSPVQRRRRPRCSRSLVLVCRIDEKVIFGLLSASYGFFAQKFFDQTEFSHFRSWQAVIGC